MRHIAWILWRGILILALFVGLIFFIIKIQSDPFIKSQSDLPHAQTVIVLGAGLLSNGKPSGVLKDRLEIAIALYNGGKVEKILVTGDNSRLSYNEVNPSRDYLLIRGIPDKDIFLDHAGFDTYSSMYRAQEVFLVDTAIIVTQSFHLPRAVFTARRLGITAYGTPADQHAYRIKNNLRELLADVKAVYDVVYGRIPKYLGKDIPITGDGRLDN